jgi:hypothetical protein
VHHVFRPGSVDFAALDLPGPDGARAPDVRNPLSDHPGLFARGARAVLDARHGLCEGPLDAAVAAYRTTLTA